MRKIKTFAFIGIISVAYLCGYLIGFGMSSITTKANANNIPNINNVQNTQGNISYETIYINGQRYIVFINRATSADIEVIKQ